MCGMVGSGLEVRVVARVEPEERVMAGAVPEESMVGRSEPGVHREAGSGPEVHGMASKGKACIEVKLGRSWEIWAGVQRGGAVMEGSRGSAKGLGAAEGQRSGLGRWHERAARAWAGGTGLGWRRDSVVVVGVGEREN